MSPRKSGLAAPGAPAKKRGLTQVEVAERLRKSTSWIRTLTTKGVLTRDEDGTYPWPQVAEEHEAYEESLEDVAAPSADRKALEEARTRKYLVEAQLREDELAALRGDLVPVDEVLDRVRAPLEAIDAKLRAAPRKHAKALASKLRVSQAVAIRILTDVIEGCRADLREVFGDDADDAAA